MNTFLLYTMLTTIGTSYTTTIGPPTYDSAKEIVRKGKKLLQAQASYQQKKALFKITISNDSGVGYYSLKRFDKDGTVVLVECKEIRNGESIRTYEFEDEELPKDECTYEISRVEVLNKESELVNAWQFDVKKRQLVELK